jgi:hypothetical protein
LLQPLRPILNSTVFDEKPVNILNILPNKSGARLRDILL